MSKGICEIPPITDPMGRYWDQPPRERILVDDDWALMTRADWHALHHYNHSIPTATYAGKMWGYTDRDGMPFLCWFDRIIGETITVETRPVMWV